MHYVDWLSDYPCETCYGYGLWEGEVHPILEKEASYAPSDKCPECGADNDVPWVREVDIKEIDKSVKYELIRTGNGSMSTFQKEEKEEDFSENMKDFFNTIRIEK